MQVLPGVLQQVLAGAARSLEALRGPTVEGQEPQQVVKVLQALLPLLSDSLAADGSTGSRPPPKM